MYKLGLQQHFLSFPKLLYENSYAVKDKDPDKLFQIRLRMRPAQKFRIWQDPDTQHWLGEEVGGILKASMFIN